jgi:DNA-binding CsgD family transcriptional regulator
MRAHLFVPDLLECLASLADGSGSHLSAVRLLGAAHMIRQRNGVIRCQVYEAEFATLVERLRSTLGPAELGAAWDAGAALSTDEAIAYALRGHGERRRPSTGWDALTPTECDVLRLLSEGLGNKDIATRLFISPRTVQTHLTHVYAKLGLTSRVQLAQEAARRN